MSNETKKPSVLISDLGNVLAFFDHMTIANNLAAQLELNSKKVFQGFLTSDIHGDYVLGRIDDEEFYERAKGLFGNNEFPSFQQFANIWSDIFTTNWAIVKTLRKLKSEMILLLLSNTNNLHFRWIEEHHPEIVELFGKKLILSHQMGAAKPDVEIFEAAKRAAGPDVDPSDCLYIDDIAEYVSVAESYGMQAHQYIDHHRFMQWLDSVLS